MMELTNLMPLERLKAQDVSLSGLITCTERDISKLTTACLQSLQTQLAQAPASREKVTDAVVALWTSLHLGFFTAHGIEGRAMDQVYELSGMWLRQRLFAAQLADAAAAVRFGQHVTVRTPEQAERSRLFETLLETAQASLAASGLGADAGFLAASEIVADVATELYGIERLPHGQDLWPLVASRLRWQSLMSRHAPELYGV